MLVLGITGGVGSGKSAILTYLEEHYNCRILLSDDAAKKLEEPGEPLYAPLVSLLSVYDEKRGRSLLTQTGEIDKAEMAARIFADASLLKKVNQLVHPAVNTYILEQIGYERARGVYEFFVLESAILIENGYRDVADSLWYVYCSEAVRRERLASSRGYTQEKITSIMKNQLSEEEFYQNCDVVIDNSGELTGENGSYAQVDRAITELRNRTVNGTL